MPTYPTAADYIAKQPIASQQILNELCSLVLKAVPKAEELKDAKVPSFRLVAEGKSDQQIMMAGYKNYVSFYPFPAAVAAYQDQLTDYKLGKGSIQFPLGQPLPKQLIIKLVKYRKKELQEGS